MTNRGLPLLLLALVYGPARAEPQPYAIDPVHSRIVFFVSHAGFSRAIGTFSGISGELAYDPDAPAQSSVRASVPIASLDLGDAKWRERVLDRTFLAVKKFPEARFASTTVRQLDDGRLLVSGELSLHGVTRTVELETRPNREGRHPLTLRGTIGFSARTTLSRAGFGMDKWNRLVGDEVEVLLEIEATRQRKHREKG